MTLRTFAVSMSSEVVLTPESARARASGSPTWPQPPTITTDMLPSENLKNRAEAITTLLGSRYWYFLAGGMGFNE